MRLSGNVKFFLELQSQLKYYIGKLRVTQNMLRLVRLTILLGGIIDTYVEMCMGIYGRFRLEEDERTHTIQNLSDVDRTWNDKTVGVGYNKWK
jgi:hypothetical protein